MKQPSSQPTTPRSAVWPLALAGWLLLGGLAAAGVSLLPRAAGHSVAPDALRALLGLGGFGMLAGGVAALARRHRGSFTRGAALRAFMTAMGGLAFAAGLGWMLAGGWAALAGANLGGALGLGLAARQVGAPPGREEAVLILAAAALLGQDLLGDLTLPLLVLGAVLLLVAWPQVAELLARVRRRPAR